MCLSLRLWVLICVSCWFDWLFDLFAYLGLWALILGFWWVYRCLGLFVHFRYLWLCGLSLHCCVFCFGVGVLAGLVGFCFCLLGCWVCRFRFAWWLFYGYLILVLMVLAGFVVWGTWVWDFAEGLV